MPQKWRIATFGTMAVTVGAGLIAGGVLGVVKDTASPMVASATGLAGLVACSVGGIYLRTGIRMFREERSRRAVPRRRTASGRL
jgi:hypothetical protein